MRRLEYFFHTLLFVLFAGALVPVWSLPGLQAVEQLLDDARIRSGLTNVVDESIVILDIDEVSLSELGQWPWPRSTLASVFDVLFDHYEIQTLGLDFVLAEPTPSRESFLQSLMQQDLINLNAPINELAQIRPEDDALSAAMAGRNIVAGFVFKQSNSEQLNRLPAPLLTLPDLSLPLSLYRPNSFTGNVSIFSDAARVSGFFDNPSVDSDGVYRRAALIQQYGDDLYPSLALSVARLAISGETLAEVDLVDLTTLNEQISVGKVQLGRFIIPLSEQGTVRVPFHHAQQGFDYVSVADVLAKNIAIDKLLNKIVLMGTTAPGLKDIRNTPANAQMPGVEVHANIIRGIFNQQLASQPEWRLPVELSILFLTALVLWFVYKRRKPWFSISFSLVWLALFSWLNVWAWQAGFLMTLAPFMLMTLSMYILHSSWELLIENHAKRRITRLFGQYVPPKLVDDLAEFQPANLLEGQERELTVLFSDVRGFTSLSENLNPNELTDLMNRLLTPLTNVIHQNNGTIDKYMGDAIMAFWGAPIPQENHASLAVASAIAMQDALHDIQASLTEFNVGELAMGVGIHTGAMAVGNMGSEFRMAYTVMGDAVNLGSRLEGLTRQYGVDILVSEAVQESASEFGYLPIDRVLVKGKTKPVSIYTPVGRLDEMGRNAVELISRMNRFLEDYRTQNWSACLQSLIDFEDENSDYSELWALYRTRVQQLQETSLPDDWDGVFKHTSKS